MTRVKLIHWNASEVQQRAEKLRAAGYEVDHEAIDGPASLRDLKRNPPTAIVIDLSRAPSQGRDVAILLRRTKATRHIPVVFVAGDADKVARIQKLLPDASYTTWSGIRGALKRAIAKPQRTPTVPDQMAGYSGAPLVKKLGIKEDCVVALINPPTGFSETLGKLPTGVIVKSGNRSHRDLTI